MRGKKDRITNASIKAIEQPESSTQKSFIKLSFSFSGGRLEENGKLGASLINITNQLNIG